MWLWVATALAGGTPCTDTAQMQADSAKLRALFDADTADRTSRNPDVYKNDTKRAKEILAMREGGRICSATDKYLAAATLQHSQEPDEIKISYDLAVEAMNAHAPNSAWLVANIFDRHKVARGLAQYYGTQFSMRDGKKCIFEVDPAATDEERKQHGIQPLADTYTQLLAESGKAGYDPTAEILVRYNLVCESKAWR
jgi:hypothetical protein